MRLVLCLSVFLLSSCQPQVGARGNVASGISSVGEDLQGIWYTDHDGETIQFSYSLNNLRFVRGGILNQRSIQFVSQSSYYDYTVGEYASYSFTPNGAQVCYDIGCHDLRKNP